MPTPVYRRNLTEKELEPVYDDWRTLFTAYRLAGALSKPKRMRFRHLSALLRANGFFQNKPSDA